MNPMVPLLTGALAGSAVREFTGFLAITGVEVNGLDSFVLTFASGLKLRVRVFELPPEDDDDA